MKKHHLLASCAAIALINTPSHAMEIKPFIGANISTTFVEYSSEAKEVSKSLNIERPETFLGIGVEGGFKITNDTMWNPAITVAYDYVFDEEFHYFVMDNRMNVIDGSGDIGFSSLSVTFDNYLRVFEQDSKRSDIVLGIGFARITERLSIDPILNKDYHGNAVVLKAGFNQELEKHLDAYVNGRFFIPTASESIADTAFNLNVGIRFVF